MRLLLVWIVTALAVLIGASILPGAVVTSFAQALLVALVLGLINVFLKPILVILTLPINILTLGLFTFVINALLIMLTDSLVDGFVIGGFWNALLLSVIIAIFQGALGEMQEKN